MVVGLGVDLVELDRVAQMIERWGDRLIEKLMGPGEAESLPGSGGGRHVAVARAIAGKEAASKALGTGWSHGVQWSHVVVDLLAPEVRLEGRAAAVARARGARSRGPLWLETRGNLVIAEFRLLSDPGSFARRSEPSRE
jgi:holo-[acyl-carrier protein] synthase